MSHLGWGITVEETRVMVDKSGELGLVQQQNQQKKLLQYELTHGSIIAYMCVCVCERMGLEIFFNGIRKWNAKIVKVHCKTMSPCITVLLYHSKNAKGGA